MDTMLAIFEQAALEAGKTILDVRSAGAHTRLKPDSSPVTEADERAEAIILAALAQHFADIPVIAEEAVAAGRIPDTGGGRFFLVDPLDGTKEFIAGRNDFTVNIALIEDGVPTIGFVYAPALDIAYAGDRDRAWKIGLRKTEPGKVEFGSRYEISARTAIRCRAMLRPPIAVASRSHLTPETESYLQRCGAAETRSIGSSLKFGLLAEGIADIYPRFSRTMEWDTAAGDAVLRAAGGRTITLDGAPLAYGKRGRADEADFANPDFIAEGAPAA